MANFFADNPDIQFYFKHMNVGHLASIMEQGFSFAENFDKAPQNDAEAIEKYRNLLETSGKIAGDIVAPTAGETDVIGNILNEDGSVTYTPGITKALETLSDAGLMGFTLPYKYGGINCPNLIYTMSIDIMSRADAALMNLYGLQGIAETINSFASDELKDEFLPAMSSGSMTGAMVLTEPNAGSDLQNVQVKAYQDENGQWFIKGVKRFITNGCGHVLLVLARSEEGSTDGRGLSLFLVERGPTLRVRRLENKLGINGSPTCELEFSDTPARLVGERQQGLIKYVMALMYGARMGVAAQAIGIGEAAYRYARNYASERKQFGTAIDNFPAIQELLVEMYAEVQAARALTYYSSYSVDLDYDAQRKIAADDFADEDEKKKVKNDVRSLRRINSMLTPMSKYYASEMSSRVAFQGISVMGGLGYMHEHPLNRLWRDSRITSIYEGTSQMQIIASVSGAIGGTTHSVVESILDREWSEDLIPLVDEIRAGLTDLREMGEFIKDGREGNYRRLYARKIVDMAMILIIGSIFCDQAMTCDCKKGIAKYWISSRMPEFRKNKQMVCSDDSLVIDELTELAPVLEY